MQDLNISTGLKEYNINGKCVVCFNPTDPAFINKIFDAFNKLDEKHDEYSKAISGEEDGKKLFEIARSMDREMRETINGVFGCDVCTPVFGDMSVYAAADGLPLWANLLLAIIDEMDDSFAREKKATNPRIEKYTKKFTKRKAV